MFITLIVEAFDFRNVFWESDFSAILNSEGNDFQEIINISTPKDNSGDENIFNLNQNSMYVYKYIRIILGQKTNVYFIYKKDSSTSKLFNSLKDKTDKNI